MKEYFNQIFNAGLGIATANFTPQSQPAPIRQPAPATASPGMSQKTLLWIGGAIAAVIVLVLVLKKK
jgi:hypothetical protein